MPKQTYDITNSLKLFEKIKNNIALKFFGDPILRKKCINVETTEFGNEVISKICTELIDAIKKYREITGTGRGVAANQIGYDKRIIVTWFEDKPEVFINLEIISSEGEGSYWETCMSSGGLLTGEVLRPWNCVFKYCDIKGKGHTLEANEKETRVLLHELDHLDGEYCLDKYEKKTAKYVFGGKEEIFSFPFKRLDIEK